MPCCSTGRVVPTLFTLTFPVIAVVVTQTFVAILEAYWVSRLGTEAVAGVSLVLPILILMGTMSNGGIGGGVSSAVARAIGADKQDDANALLLHSVIVALAFGLVFTLGTIFLAPQVYSSLGGHGQTLEFALTYSAWVFGGAPLIWTVNLLASAHALGRRSQDPGDGELGGGRGSDTYLRVVAPSYGFFGVGLMLYFASQGRSNMLWPFVAGSLRLAVTVAGAPWLASSGISFALIVAPIAVGSVLFGLTNAAEFVSDAKRLATRRATLTVEP